MPQVITIRAFPYRASLLIGQLQFMTGKPGFHFGCLTVVLLRLQRGVQHHRPPLRLQLQNLPQLAHVPRSLSYKLHLGSPERSDDPCPVQDLLYTSPPPRQLSLECLEDQSKASLGHGGWVTFQVIMTKRHL